MMRRDGLLNRLERLEGKAGVVNRDAAERALLASLPTETLEALEALLSGKIGPDPGEPLAAAVARLTGPGSRRRD